MADALRRRDIDAEAMRDWRSGEMLGRSDEEILAVAVREERALVTYDVRSIPPLLRRLAETGASHAGVVLVSAKSLPMGDVRRLARALERLCTRETKPLRDQVLFLIR